uniref:Nucleotid_trans domain-containing protein n=1 Tax=Steinernema glaseri TaxID=37863 RepID=A0A1I8AX03_9BILA
MPKKPKKEFDGPLIMKDLPAKPKGRNVIQGIAALPMAEVHRGNEDVVVEPDRTTNAAPKLQDDFMKKFRSTARHIDVSNHTFVYLTLVNAAYQNLTLNWMCNVASFKKAHILNRTIVVSMDEKTCKAIRKQWEEVNCIYLHVEDGYNKALDWGKRNYVNLLNARVKLMRELVELEIPYVLFETDAVWLRDPTEFFAKSDLLEDADIIVPLKGYQEKGLTYSFDPMIVYPTNASKSLLAEMERALAAADMSFDQDVLDGLCKSQFKGVVCRTFEWAEIADGKWFKLSEPERAKIRPYIVNNNYYVGVHNKVARQAINNLWFLTPKGQCALSKVEKALKKRNKN